MLRVWFMFWDGTGWEGGGVKQTIFPERACNAAIYNPIMGRSPRWSEMKPFRPKRWELSSC